MKLTVDGEVFEFRQDRITNVEGMAIERATGMLFSEWSDLVNKGSVLAQTALVWVVKKRQEPTLTFDQVVYERLVVDGGDEEADPKDDDSGSELTA